MVVADCDEVVRLSAVIALPLTELGLQLELDRRGHLTDDIRVTLAGGVKALKMDDQVIGQLTQLDRLQSGDCFLAFRAVPSVGAGEEFLSLEGCKALVQSQLTTGCRLLEL